MPFVVRLEKARPTAGLRPSTRSPSAVAPRLKWQFFGITSASKNKTSRTNRRRDGRAPVVRRHCPIPRALCRHEPLMSGPCRQHGDSLLPLFEADEINCNELQTNTIGRRSEDCRTAGSKLLVDRGLVASPPREWSGIKGRGGSPMCVKHL